MVQLYPQAVGTQFDCILRPASAAVGLFFSSVTTRKTYSTRAYTHSYIHTYIHTYTHTHICTQTRIQTDISTYMHIHIRNTYTHTRTYTHTYVQTYTHTHIHTYIHTYIVYIHTYVRTYSHTWITQKHESCALTPSGRRQYVYEIVVLRKQSGPCHRPVFKCPVNTFKIHAVWNGFWNGATKTVESKNYFTDRDCSPFPPRLKTRTVLVQESVFCCCEQEWQNTYKSDTKRVQKFYTLLINPMKHKFRANWISVSYTSHYNDISVNAEYSEISNVRTT
jgi:hypothetical protein